MPQYQALYTFLPWVRQGITAAAQVTDTLADGVPGRLTLPVRLWVNERDPVEMQVRFYGPGDVLGIDPRAIVRREPRPTLSEFPPNLFALIEFDRPDFPWLFTPARADSAGRLRPWLVLVIVPRQPSTQLTLEPQRPLPVLECPLRELPDLAESWAWAHAQVVRYAGEPGAPTLDQLLRDYPERTIARLLCPRRLLPDQAYLACLVPAFAAGRDAGLGEGTSLPDTATLEPAWPTPTPNATTLVRLPVYHHWEFETGPAGDFEALVRRLQVRDLPHAVGLHRVAIHAPGWGMPAQAPGSTGTLLELAAVLRPPATRPAAWPETARAAFQENLRTILNGLSDPAVGPVIMPPIYGQAYARTAGVPAESTQPHWLRELNLDPRARIAAGLGAMVVRFEQERLMASAWRQLAAAEQDWQVQRRAQLGATVGETLRAKHQPAVSVPASLMAATAVAGAQLAAAVPGFARTPAVETQPVSYAGGSLARRLQVRGQLAPVAAAPAGMARAAGVVSLPLEPPRLTPQFPQPMVEPLRNYFAEMLLPGLGQVPPNTVALLESNPAFIESYLVGLNHEMGREFLWREFPANPRGTYFQNFWSRYRAVVSSSEPPPLPDLPPIADWTPDSHLGDHLRQGAGLPPVAPDPVLESDIAAQEAILAGLLTQQAALETTLAGQQTTLDAANAAAQPARIALRTLHTQLAQVSSLVIAAHKAEQEAASAQAEVAQAQAAAAATQASVDDERAALAALEPILAQIVLAEATVRHYEGEVARLTAEIDDLPALAVRLEDARSQNAAAATAGRAQIADIETQASTIPTHVAAAAAADTEAAAFHAQAATAQAEAAAIRAQADPARRRLAELDILAAQGTAYKEEIPNVESQIGFLEYQIAEHLANKPPEPPDPKVSGQPPSRAGGIGDGDPYDDYYEWLKELERLQGELAAAQEHLADLNRWIAEIEAQLAEAPALWDQVNAAEAQAAPFDATAAAALQAARAAEAQAANERAIVAHLQALVAQIPSIQAAVAAADAEVARLTMQIDGLPQHAVDLEAARSVAQDHLALANIALADLQAQAATAPALQAAIQAAEAQAAVFDARAASAQATAQQALTQAATLRAQATQQQAAAAQLPALEANLAQVEAPLQTIVDQLAVTRTQLESCVTAQHATMQQLSTLRTQRTMRQAQLVLLIRGDLLRHFAHATIYAVEAEWTDASHTQRRPGTNERYPVFQGTWSSDTVFLGFALTGVEVRGGSGHPGWYFVIQEQPTEPRFGLDAGDGTVRPVGDIAHWDDLTWDDVSDPASLPDLVYVPLSGRLSAQERPVRGPGTDGVRATWGANATHMALITQQMPARLAIHASAWLPQP